MSGTVSVSRKRICTLLYRELFSSFGAPSLEDLLAALCAHPFTEAVCPLAFSVRRTIGGVCHYVLL